MVTDEKIYVLVSPDVASMLDDQDADLADALKKEGLRIERESDPTASPDSTKKDAVLVILATAGALATITPLIQNVLNRIINRPVKVERTVMAAVTDDQGNVVTDSTGNPRYYWTTKHELLEPQSIEPTSTEATVGWGRIGLSIKSQTAGRTGNE